MSDQDIKCKITHLEQTEKKSTKRLILVTNVPEM